MSGPYDDMINLTHHVSTTHPQMAIENRAAQFSPFAALTGHDAAIKETARLTVERIELDENAIAELDRKLNMLADAITGHPEVAVTYFQPDERKTGGEYVAAMGAIKKIDNDEGAIVLMDGKRIVVKDILDIDCELFTDLMIG